MKTTNKSCPHCQIEMSATDLQSFYGVNVEIDQCRKCGGLWFDEMELYKTDTKNAEKVDLPSLSQSVILSKELICPNDNERLVEFHDKDYPKDLKIQQCPTCLGTWLNHGMFKEFAQQREGLREKRAEPKTPEEKEYESAMQKIVRDAVESGDHERLDHIVNFLKGPSPALPSEAEREVQESLTLLESRGRIFMRGMDAIMRVVPAPYKPIAFIALVIAIALDTMYREHIKSRS